MVTFALLLTDATSVWGAQTVRDVAGPPGATAPARVRIATARSDSDMGLQAMAGGRRPAFPADPNDGGVLTLRFREMERRRDAGPEATRRPTRAALAYSEGDRTFEPTEGVVLTLNDAIRLALKNNRDLLEARLARTIQEFALDVAGDRYRPTASIGPSTQVRSDRDATADASMETRLRVPTGGQFMVRWTEPLAGEEDTSGTVSIAFSQPLLRGFGVGVDTAPLEVARLRDRFDALVFREAIADTVVSTIRAWRDLARARRQLDIGEASLARARAQRELSRTLIEAGQTAAREILQSDANVADRELGLVQLRDAVASANFELIDILDIDTATVVSPRETPVARRPVPSLEEAIETALSHWPGHVRALLEKEIAEIDLEVADNDRLWDLSLDAEASRDSVGGGGRTDYSVGMRLKIPLGDRSPELRRAGARAAVKQAQWRLAEARQSMGIAVRQAVRDVEIGLRRIELARAALALAEEKLAIERSKLQQGLSSTFQLNRFEEDLVRAENAEVDAVVGYENAVTALDRTLGTTLRTWGIEVEKVGR